MLFFGHGWKPPVSTSSLLPTTSNSLGDVRVATDTGSAYVWMGAAWQLLAGGGGGGSGTEYELGNISGAVTIDWSLGSVQHATVTGNVVFTMTNTGTGGGDFELILDQDSTGNRTYGFADTISWGTPGAPVGSGPSRTDRLAFFKRPTGKYLGSYILGYSLSGAYQLLYSALFNGSTQQISLGNSNTLLPERTSQFSYSFWMKPTTTAGTPEMLTKGGGSPVRGLFTWLTGGSQILWALANSYSSNTAQITTTNAGISAGNWYHVCLVYAGTSLASGMQIYVNGVLCTATTNHDTLSATILNSQPLLLGTDAVGDPFAGRLCHFSVWSKTMSLSDVTAAYNSGTPPDLSLHPSYAYVQCWLNLCGGGDSMTTANGIGDNTGSFPGTASNMTSANLSSDVP